METLLHQLRSSSANLSSEEAAVIALVQLRADLVDWTDTRSRTIDHLRAIADYVDSVSK